MYAPSGGGLSSEDAGARGAGRVSTAGRPSRVRGCGAASGTEPLTFVAAGVFAGSAGDRPITLLDDFYLFAAHG